MIAATLPLVTPALLAGVLFSGAHAFAGMRLIDRGAAIVGLAIAQIAALGSAVAILTGHDLQSIAAEFWSVVFGFIGAMILARVRAHRETAAAIAYVVSGAAAILILSRAAQGTEHIKMMFAGNILAVSLHTLMRIAIVYVAAAAALALSATQSEAFVYAMTAVIAAFSVATAGVLLVFSYLVIPPVAAMLFSRTIGKRLAIAWATGALVTAIGILLSLQLDLPAGATIVGALGVTLLLMAGVTRRRIAV